MTIGESDRERWVRRLRAAATEAVDSGASPDELADALHEGVEDARRRIAARTSVPPPRRDDEAARPRFTPQPGSALDSLMRDTGVI